MRMYYIKTGPKYWKPRGYGYTDRREEAGIFTIRDMEHLNLDGCTLERAEQLAPGLGQPDTDTTGRAA